MSISSKLDFAGQHLRLPGVLLGDVGVEFGHHLAGEEFEALADVLVGVLAGLVQQDDLVDMRALEPPQLAPMVSGEPIRPPDSARASPSGLARFHFSYSSHRLTVPGSGRLRLGLSP